MSPQRESPKYALFCSKVMEFASQCSGYYEAFAQDELNDIAEECNVKNDGILHPEIAQQITQTVNDTR